MNIHASIRIKGFVKVHIWCLLAGDVTEYCRDTQSFMSVFIMTDCLCCHLQQEYTAVLLAAVSIVGKYHRILRLCPSLLFVHASIGKSEEGAYVRDHYIYCFMGSTFYSLGGGGAYTWDKTTYLCRNWAKSAGGCNCGILRYMCYVKDINWDL